MVISQVEQPNLFSHNFIEREEKRGKKATKEAVKLWELMEWLRKQRGRRVGWDDVKVEKWFCCFFFR